MLSEEYHVTAAASGGAAFRYLRIEWPDLILLDIVMPVMAAYTKGYSERVDACSVRIAFNMGG